MRRWLLAALVAAFPLSSPAEPRGFAATDLATLARISEPELSPNGRQVVFTLRETDLTADRGRADLGPFLAPSGQRTDQVHLMAGRPPTGFGHHGRRSTGHVRSDHDSYGVEAPGSQSPCGPVTKGQVPTQT